MRAIPHRRGPGDRHGAVAMAFKRPYEFVVITPAATLEAAPLTTELAVEPGVLERVEVVIRDGHAGLTGFALRHSGGKIVPFRESHWLHGNARVVKLDVGREISGGRLQAVTYNTDSFEHSHFVTLVLSELGETVAPTPPPIPVEFLEEPGLPGELLELPEGEEPEPEEEPEEEPEPEPGEEPDLDLVRWQGSEVL